MSEIERMQLSARMSKIVRHAGVIYLSGQTAGGSASSDADIAAQTHEALSRVDALLAEAGSNRAQILSATLYLRKMSDFAAMNVVWESWLSPGTAPARATVEAHMASESLLFEVSIIAAIA